MQSNPDRSAGVQARQRSSSARGFTLIELMIVVAIVAVLASIALPSYFKYVQKSRRADAMAALSQDQGILERCYAATFDYGNVKAAAPGCELLSADAATPSPQGYYNVTLEVPTSASFTLTATPAPGSPQESDTECASFIVTSANGHSALGSGGSDNTASCWQQ